MTDDLKELYERDKNTWDECAHDYEQHIVGGHPDILAFESFEEDLLDAILLHLAKVQEKPIKLVDIGCGSGRLHLRYARKATSGRSYDSGVSRRLKEIWGIDFSQNMINLAKKKLSDAGLYANSKIKLSFKQGSAFELEPEEDDILPVAVCLVNSIGVMQGPQGATELFKSMRRAVEEAGGIALISQYMQEYISSYALGQYESTLNVSGQPKWMIPDTYASGDHIQVPREYKRAYSEDPTLMVDVYDQEGKLVKKGHTLKRDEKEVEKTIKTGKIRTYTNYKSHWYGFNKVGDWIRKYWGDKTHHLTAKELDALRAEPAQLAILDAGDNIKDLLDRWIKQS